MVSLWPKPPNEITCPKCGTKVLIPRKKNSTFQAKPYCVICGWNVGRARADLITQLKQFAIGATFFAAYIWATTGEIWMVMVMAAWMLAIIAIPLVVQLRRLPPTTPAPAPQPLTVFANLESIDLEVVTPRWNIALEALVVLVATAAIVVIPGELDPHRRKLPQTRHELIFVVSTIIFAAYQLIGHTIGLYRLAHALWVEQQLAKRAMKGTGRIIENNSGVITYEFLDYGNHLQRGKGRDYSLALYEDMPVAVLYDPDKPSLNLPVVGLQFHRLRSPGTQTNAFAPSG